jgi:hypothetical protein
MTPWRCEERRLKLLIATNSCCCTLRGRYLCRSICIIDRALAAEALEYFCDRFKGQILNAIKHETKHTLTCSHGLLRTGDGAGCLVDVLMSVALESGCRFTGKGVRSKFARTLRRCINQYDTSSMQFKYGKI